MAKRGHSGQTSPFAAPAAPGRLAGTAPALVATVSATAATTFAWYESDGATAYTLVSTDEDGEEIRLVAQGVLDGGFTARGTNVESLWQAQGGSGLASHFRHVSLLCS